jgi:hypothetical protein
MSHKYCLMDMALEWNNLDSAGLSSPWSFLTSLWPELPYLCRVHNARSKLSEQDYRDLGTSSVLSLPHEQCMETVSAVKCKSPQGPKERKTDLQLCFCLSPWASSKASQHTENICPPFLLSLLWFRLQRSIGSGSLEPAWVCQCPLPTYTRPGATCYQERSASPHLLPPEWWVFLYHIPTLLYS